jgi:hypothetical protein
MHDLNHKVRAPVCTLDGLIRLIQMDSEGRNTAEYLAMVAQQIEILKEVTIQINRRL